MKQEAKPIPTMMKYDISQGVKKKTYGIFNPCSSISTGPFISVPSTVLRLDTGCIRMDKLIRGNPSGGKALFGNQIFLSHETSSATN
jgi:hypothetical protein